MSTRALLLGIQSETRALVAGALARLGYAPRTLVAADAGWRINWVSPSFTGILRRSEAAVIEFAHRHRLDLMITSTHGRTGVGRLMLGKMVRLSPCPVLTIKAPSRSR